MAALVGVVRDARTSVPLPGARVIAEWVGGEVASASGDGGRYELCGLPGVKAIRVRVDLPPARGPTERVELGTGEVRTLDLTFDIGTLGVGTGGVVGRVRDAETLRPVEGALVGIEGPALQTLTGSDGRFALHDVPAGTVTLELHHIAYGDHRRALEVPSGASLDLDLTLAAQAVPLEPLQIVVRGRRSVRLERVGFYERRAWMEKLGLGHFITREDIERRGSMRLSQVVGDVPRVDFFRAGRYNLPVITGRNPDCRRVKREGLMATIGPSVYVNGRLFRLLAGGGVFGIDDLANPSDVAGIEVYTGLGDLPVQFADPNAQKCGAIAIWTGR